MVDRFLQSRIVNYIWHGFVILLSFASLIEAIFGLLPIPSEYESSVKSLFMGLTLIGAFYEVANRLLSSYHKKNNLLEMVENAFVDNESYTFSCHCGSKQCRHIINGTDWKLKTIQKKYRKYFSPYLKKISFP